VVVLAETRKRTPESRAALEAAINKLAADLIATPPEVVVLAPPNTVLRTSSGKIRRSACRALYEEGGIGTTASAVWLQIARLALRGLRPQCERAWRHTRGWVYSIYAWSVFLPLAATALLLTLLPLPTRFVWRGVRTLTRSLAFLTATRVHCEGLDEIPASGVAAVLAINHQSYLDGMLILAVLPRPPRVLVKAELRASPLLGRALTRLGVLFVERFDAAAGVASMGAATQALAAGEMLVVFPEGTFKRMPGLLPFHMGAFTLAAESGVPLVAVALRGTRSILRAGSWFVRHGHIEVKAGTPLRASVVNEVWSEALLLRDAARAHILAYNGEPDLAHESNAVGPD
jgi:1-acyl-sn-glycerol-3-phosphate acyltransferase